MKVFTGLLMVLLSVSLYGADFESLQLISGDSPEGPRSLFSSDLTGDGHPDIIGISEDGERLFWYQNLGSLNFGPQQLFGSGIYRGVCVHADDLDNDGDNDVLAAIEGAGSIIWFENLGGSFGPEQLISNQMSEASWVTTGDLDNDGFVDVIGTAKFNNKVTAFRNLGGGVFAAPKNLTTSAAAATSAEVADLNGDGLMDVVASSRGDNKISWFQNNGPLGFSSAIIVSTSTSGARNVYPSDLDGDGDVDLAVIGSGKVFRIENTGVGTFAAAVQVTSNVSEGSTVYTGDLDGDGDQDIISASANDARIAWYPNNGGLTFGPQITVSEDARKARRAIAADMDNDGDLDIISASQQDDKIAIYENTGDGSFMPEVLAGGTPASSVQDVQAADLDNDGDVDVFSANYDAGKVVWYENDGAGNFSTQKIISTAILFPEAVVGADVDGDGFTDIIAGDGLLGNMQWFRNLGGSFAPGIALDLPPFNVTDLAVADLDGDSDMDLLVAAAFNGFYWYENIGGDYSGAKIGLPTAYAQGNSINAADLDGDGDMDIIGTGQLTLVADSKVVWFENSGAGIFSSSVDIATTTSRMQNAEAGDVDGDGDLDVVWVAAAFSDYQISWHENQGGGVFVPRASINSVPFVSHGLQLGDLDGDGDLDVVGGEPIDINVLNWYQNDGSGNFSGERFIGGSARQIREIELADLNGDGLPDVISASELDDQIAWFANNICQTPVNLSSNILSPNMVMVQTDIVNEATKYLFNGRKSGMGMYRTVQSGSNLKTITFNFKPGTTYEWFVNAVCGADTSASSTLAYFTMPLLRVDVDVDVLPNPVADYLQISTPVAGIFQLFNSTGQLVKTQALNSGNTVVNMYALPAGIYLWQFEGETFVKKGKLVLNP